MTLRNIAAAATAIVFSLLLVWSASSTVRAEEACEYTMAGVIAEQLIPNEVPFVMVPDEDLAGLVADLEAVTGQTFEGVTRAFAANIRGNLVIGLEVGGCLLDPIVIATVPQSTVNKSGRVGNQTFA